LFHVYLLRCSDGTFYAGSCENLADRVATHNRGEGAAWTAKRRPVELVHSESFPTRAEAVAREKQLKRWTHAKKVALATGDTDHLRALAARSSTGSRSSTTVNVCTVLTATSAPKRSRRLGGLS
jgi:predicted GIY-YIG superfamily endonuclease